MDSSNCEYGNTAATEPMLIQKNVHGFSFVKNCPIDPDATQRLLETIGPIRETHYGEYPSLCMVSHVKLKLTC